MIVMNATTMVGSIVVMLGGDITCGDNDSIDGSGSGDVGDNSGDNGGRGYGSSGGGGDDQLC